MKRNQLLLVLVIFIVLVIVGTAVAAYMQAGKAVARYEEERPLPGAALYDQSGTLIKRLGEGSVFVPLEKIPRSVQDAVRTTEKTAGTGEAITNRLAADIMQPKGLWQRLQFTFVPTVLNRRHSPDERLEIYLNRADFGEQTRGVEAASQVYFGKSVQAVNLAESALLAALALEPESASPLTRPKRAQELRNEILAQMERDGKINTSARKEAAEEPLAKQKHIPGRAHFFADYVNQLLTDKLSKERVHAGGLEIETTLDLKLQQLAEDIFTEYQLEGALIALNPEHGQILTMVGGLDFQKNKTNLATARNKDMAGSLRPILYAAALAEGWAMNHLVEDVQRKFDDFEATNRDERYWGAVTMKHALRMDLNNAAIWTLNRLSIDKFSSFADKVGIGLNSGDQKLSLAMGQTELGLSLLEVTASYLPGPTEGLYSEPAALAKVEDANGRKALTIQKPSPKRVLSEQEAYLFTNMLFPHAEALDLDFEAALHASIAEEEKNQWAIGYTPSLLAGVYIKNAEDADAAALIWAQFMIEANKQLKAAQKEFTVPADVETDVLIDVFTGLLASERCPQVELDAFIKGTKPTDMAPCAIPPPPPTPAAPPIPSRPTRPPQEPEVKPPAPAPEKPAPPTQPEPERPGESTPPTPEKPVEPEEPESELPEPQPEPPPEPPPELEPPAEPQPETEPDTEVEQPPA